MQIERGESSSCANPKIDVYTTVAGTLVDVFSLEYAIDDATGDEAVQVFPDAGYEAVDVDQGCPDGGRISLGHYVAAWSAANDEALGTHVVRWRARVADGGSLFSWSEEFEVVAALVLSDRPGSYTTVARMRDEGITEAMANDSRLTDIIEEMSREIDRATGWWFEARDRTLVLDGSGHQYLRMPAPVISIDEVRIDDVAFDEDSWAIEGSAPVEDAAKPIPTLRRIDGYDWVESVRNIEVDGTFGYTEYDGTASGRTPFAIRRCCELMVARVARPHLRSADDRRSGRIKMMQTNRQKIEFFSGQSAAAAFDEDADISRILSAYRRPRARGV